MNKLLLSLALTSLALVACTSKNQIAIGTLEFQYPSSFEIDSHEVIDSLGMEIIRFVDQKDSVGFLILQVTKEQVCCGDSNTSCPQAEYLSLVEKKAEGRKNEKEFKLEDGEEKRLKQLARPVGKYLAEKSLEVYREQFTPINPTELDSAINEVDDIRILIDDPMVVEAGAFASGKVGGKRFSAAIRSTLFCGYRIIAYAQSTADDKVDGFMGIYTSVREK